LEVKVSDGGIRIIREGSVRKFVKQVEQISFSSSRSRRTGRKVLYVTERAVFQLTAEGLELIEAAPGIDLQKQVLDLMDFSPIIRAVRPMPAHVFSKSGRI
jgi:propionate CoA-transferase